MSSIASMLGQLVLTAGIFSLVLISTAFLLGSLSRISGH